MGLSFHTLDVFTTTRFGGNPLAVVLDADALDTATMQTVAREFNLSETVFVLKPDHPAHTARVRIFTPTAEMPFAGHPTVGTAALLAELRSPGVSGEQDAIIVLEEKIGPVRVGVKLRGGSRRSPNSMRRGCLRRRGGRPAPIVSHRHWASLNRKSVLRIIARPDTRPATPSSSCPSQRSTRSPRRTSLRRTGRRSLLGKTRSAFFSIRDKWPTPHRLSMRGCSRRIMASPRTPRQGVPRQRSPE
jgi:hypothetical protein